MRILRLLLSAGAVLLGLANVQGASTTATAETWLRLDDSCPSGNICEKTDCQEGGISQCSAQYCNGTGCTPPL